VKKDLFRHKYMDDYTGSFSDSIAMFIFSLVSSVMMIYCMLFHKIVLLCSNYQRHIILYDANAPACSDKITKYNLYT